LYKSKLEAVIIWLILRIYTNNATKLNQLIRLPQTERSSLARSQRLLVFASVARTGTLLLRLLVIVVGTLILNTDLLDAASTARDSRGIAIVGVDADEGLAAGGLDAADLDGALELLAAVAAGAVQLAEVLHGEVLDDHLAAGVVLDDLVVGVAGAAADNAGGAAAAALEGESVCNS
jgi:uncharacterized protein YceH (UPF0502 family)